MTKHVSGEYSRATVGELLDFCLRMSIDPLQLMGTHVNYELASGDLVDVQHQNPPEYVKLMKHVCGEFPHLPEYALIEFLGNMPRDTQLSYVSSVNYRTLLAQMAENDDPRRFDVFIPAEAKVEEVWPSGKGVQVKEAFYTAGWTDYPMQGPLKRKLGAVNHKETYVIPDGVFTDSDILVRTGNGIIGIRPAVKKIDERGEVPSQRFKEGKGYYPNASSASRAAKKFVPLIGFRTRNLHKGLVAEIDKELRLTEKYETAAEIHADLGTGPIHPLLDLKNLTKALGEMTLEDIERYRYYKTYFPGADV